MMNWSSFGPVYFAIAPSEGAKTVNSLDKYCDASELCINKFLNWNLKQIDSLVQLLSMAISTLKRDIFSSTQVFSGACTRIRFQGHLVKISKFQNEFVKPLFLPKYEPNLDDIIKG